jgi:Nucleotidyltransferase domain
MSGTPADDPILKRFRAALDEIYGDRLERVVLFGSRAGGDARTDSDYDVAVFLKDFVDRRQEGRPCGAGRHRYRGGDWRGHSSDALPGGISSRTNLADVGGSQR